MQQRVSFCFLEPRKSYLYFTHYVQTYHELSLLILYCLKNRLCIHMAGEGEQNLTENVKCEWITEEVKVQVSEGGIFSKSYSFVEYIINTAVKKKRKLFQSLDHIMFHSNTAFKNQSKSQKTEIKPTVNTKIDHKAASNEL